MSKLEQYYKITKVIADNFTDFFLISNFTSSGQKGATSSLEQFIGSSEWHLFKEIAQNQPRTNNLWPAAKQHFLSQDMGNTCRG